METQGTLLVPLKQGHPSWCFTHILIQLKDTDLGMLISTEHQNYFNSRCLRDITVFFFNLYSNDIFFKMMGIIHTNLLNLWVSCKNSFTGVTWEDSCVDLSPSTSLKKVAVFLEELYPFSLMSGNSTSHSKVQGLALIHDDLKLWWYLNFTSYKLLL